MNAALIVPAAGSGTRLGLAVPKALADVCGRPLLRRTLECFAGLGGLSQIVVAVPADAAADFEAGLAGFEPTSCRLRLVHGGRSRQESVRLALGSVSGVASLVAVHDAARPLVGREMVEAVLSAADAHGAATIASRPADSVRRQADGDGARSVPIDRGRLWMVGTPQAFRTEILAEAHERGRVEQVEMTDDASLVERFTATTVALVERPERNLKVTTPEDLELVRLIFADRAARGSRR